MYPTPDGPWPVFWMEPTSLGLVGYRRYTSGDGSTCTTGHHSALAWSDEREPISIVTGALAEDGTQRRQWSYTIGDDFSPANDPKWPTSCDACGQPLPDDATRQRWIEPVYLRTDTHEERILHSVITHPVVPHAEVGAMHDAFWYPLSWLNPRKPNDGIILNVRCPRIGQPSGFHDWCVDSRSSSGGFWTRTGDPRNPGSLTVMPSIAIGDPSKPGFYHGFLRDGVLTPHIG